jgi:hypothetical protein
MMSPKCNNGGLSMAPWKSLTWPSIERPFLLFLPGSSGENLRLGLEQSKNNGGESRLRGNARVDKADSEPIRLAGYRPGSTVQTMRDSDA